LLGEIEFDDDIIKSVLAMDPTAKLYITMKDPPGFERSDRIRVCHSLAPSEELEEEFMWGKIKESDYKKKYYSELQSPVAQKLMRYILKEAMEKDVYLVSNNDDRFLLLNVMDKLK
jgi:uncharacterized protein YeaO (DUF488 family)